MRLSRGVLGYAAAAIIVLHAGSPPPIEAQTAPPAPAPSGRGIVGGKVTILKDGSPKADRSNVAVYLENVPGPLPEPALRSMRQKNLTFTPGVMVVVKGTTIEFPNDDKVFHNVFSVSKAA